MAAPPAARESGAVTPEPTTQNPRLRTLAGSHNVRDLGGLATASGLRVRTGQVFRSDYPAFADADTGALRDLGLRTVIDLRRGTEAAVERVDWESRGVICERWPLTAGRESSWHARYPAYLVHRPETVVGAVRGVMSPEGHAVLFHCAAGKDRTGVVAALLLAVLGVPADDIVADYVLSAPSVGPVLDRLVGMELYSAMLAGSTAEDQEPRAEHMHALLDWLGERGGAEGWLLDHGAPDVEISNFRDAMLEG